MPNWAAFLRIVAVGRFRRLAMVSSDCEPRQAQSIRAVVCMTTDPFFVCPRSPSFPLHFQPDLYNLPDSFRPRHAAMRCRPLIDSRNRGRLKSCGNRFAELDASRATPRFFVYSFCLLGHDYSCTRKTNRGEHLSPGPTGVVECREFWITVLVPCHRGFDSLGSA